MADVSSTGSFGDAAAGGAGNDSGGNGGQSASSENSFTNAAAGGNGTTAFSGTRNENETEEERERREKARKKHEDELIQQGERAAQNKKPPKYKNDGWDQFYRRLSLGIRDHGDYISFSGQGQPVSQTKKGPSEKQMMHIIMNLVLNKGYTTIHCYSGHKVDQALCSQAKQMLTRLQQPGGPLEGIPARVSTDPMKEPPHLGRIGRWQHERNIAREAKAAAKAHEKLMKAAAPHVTPQG